MAPWASPLPPAPAEPFGPSGAPAFGAYAGPLERAALGRAAAHQAQGWFRRVVRRKRWIYLLAASDEAMVAAAVVEGGWFGAGFAWVLDRSLGAMAFDRTASGLPGLNARVDDRIGPGGGARFSGLGLAIDVQLRAGGADLRVVARNGIRAEVALDARGAPSPFVLVTPVEGPGVRVTQKAGGLRASGRVELAGRTLRLDGGLGGLDATHGFLARETAWRWAFGTGTLPGGEPFAFNLAEGFGGVPPGDPGENALLLGEATVRLPAVRFTFDRDAPHSPWRVASADGALDLAFAPVAVHRDDRDMGPLSTRFRQVAGTFAGTLPSPRGPLAVAGVPGVVEDHRARW
jgi:hypothetical protein